MRLQDNQHYLLLLWLVITGLIIFGVVVSWQEDLIWQLIDGDRSRICLLIGLLYALASIHCAIRVVFLSRELEGAETVASQLSAAGLERPLKNQNGTLMLVPDVPLKNCVMTEHLIDLIISKQELLIPDAPNEHSNLTEALSERLKGAHELGWFVVDILLKLGLIGTIIGFVLMLGSVSNTSTFDVTTMQKILREMSSGMGTALFTTLAGLVGSMLLGLQYLLLDKGADELLHRIIRVAEIQLKPRINGDRERLT